ncbi:hypothetical protein HK100_011621 [Physocladia obscura]|uniref:Uncharacterized protein n=1 Tax=Physocladia obscura TaxID=109957 RepID=A0AAD5T113_9FUNG|nr:hypothetical protein HK100_011621 [Physocladia obscura]
MIVLTPPPLTPLPPPPVSLNELTSSGRTLKRGILHVQLVHDDGRNADGEFLAVLSAAHSALYLFATDVADASDALDKNSNTGVFVSVPGICVLNDADPLFVLGLDPSSTVLLVSSNTDTSIDTVLGADVALHNLATDIVVNITAGVAQWKLLGGEPSVLDDWRACIKSVIELSVAQTQIKLQHSSQQIQQSSQSLAFTLNLKQSAGSVHISRSVPTLMQPRIASSKPPSLVLKSSGFSGVSSRPMGEIRVTAALSPPPLSADTHLTKLRSVSAFPAFTKSNKSSIDSTASLNFPKPPTSLQIIASNTSHKITKTEHASFGLPSSISSISSDNITISTPQLMSISSQSVVFRDDSLSSSLNTSTNSSSSSCSSSFTFGAIPYQELLAPTSVSANAAVAFTTTSRNNPFRLSSSSPSSSSSAKSDPEKKSRALRDTSSRSPSFSQGGQTLSELFSKIGWSKKKKSEKEPPSVWKSPVAMRKSKSMGVPTDKF